MKRKRKRSINALGLILVVAASSWGCDRADRSLTEAGGSSPHESPAQADTMESAPPASEGSAELDQARPATASASEPTQGRPPHPAIPSPIEEPSPSPNTLASTTYRWLPGHWIWTGNQYTWQPGVWIYDLPGSLLLPPQWTWDADYWTFRDTGWARPGADRAVYRPTALPDGSATMAPTPDPNEAQVDLEVSPSSYPAYVWTGTWVAPPIVYPSEIGGSVVPSRYARRIRAEASTEPSLDAVPPSGGGEPSVGQVVEQATPPATEEPDEDEVEYVPGVLHGGKRGEEEMRLMQEAQEREAAEQAEGEDAVFVPYYWGYPHYPARPVRPRPPRPEPGPGRPPPHRPPSSRPR